MTTNNLTSIGEEGVMGIGHLTHGLGKRLDSHNTISRANKVFLGSTNSSKRPTHLDPKCDDF
jgi:hypothetical protein